MSLPILTQQGNDSSIDPNDAAEASLHISSMCGGACWDGNLLQAPLSLSLWSSFLVEKALHCQVGFAYMMRIIGRLKWDTSVRLTSYTDWPKKCVCVLLKIASPFPPRRFAFRFSPMVFLYLSTVIPSIWFLELSLLQYKLPVNISSGPELEELLAHIPISAVGITLQPPPQQQLTDTWSQIRCESLGNNTL